MYGFTCNKDEQKRCEKTCLMISNTYLQVNIVSEILVKNQKLLTLIINGTEKIYPTLYIPYVGHVRCVVDNKESYLKFGEGDS